MARKRKYGPRWPCGKLRTVVKQLEEAERENRNRERATVLAQPHRRGEESQLAESAIGRFILKHGLRREFYDASLKYATKKRKWLAAMDAPLPDRLGGSGADIPLEKIKKWGREVLEWERAMIDAGGTDGLLSVTWMAFHNYDFAPGASVSRAKGSLLALAVAVGMIERRAVN